MFLEMLINDTHFYCVKIIRIRSYYGSYFPAFGLNTERHGVSLRIQSECGKIQTRFTPNTDTFHVVFVSQTIVNRSLMNSPLCFTDIYIYR